MKKRGNLRLVPKRPAGPPVVFELDAITPEGVRSMYVERFGPECATWLLRDLDRRRKARNGQRILQGQAKVPFGGTFVLTLREGAKLPPWLDIAMSFLKKRAGWQVGTSHDSSGKQDWYLTRLGKHAGDIRA